jgi:anti-sigma regulatory factor (Ser/Thr protein kinase)
MEIVFTEWVPVTDASSVGAVRRAAQGAARKLEFDETRAGELALLATEVSRNVLIHGGGGQVIVSGMEHGAARTARILAMDNGAGIANVAQAMTDGYSTAGTPGGGLGAMKRIATQFEVLTGRGGTIVLLELVQAPREEDPRQNGLPIAGLPIAGLPLAGLVVPYPGERLSGDGWACHADADRTLVLLVDGLGHGREAHDAAQEAIAGFREHAGLGPGDILGYLHDGLRKTRGAVAAVAEILPGQRQLTYAGVGNISCVLLADGKSHSLVSHNGTLGMTARKIQEFHAEWPPDGVLILHSDGVQTRWDLSSYSGLLARHSAVIAGALLRDFRRQRDDASVVVVKAA